MDAQGNLWSSPNGMANSGVVWLRPPPLLPPTTNDWQVLFTGAASPYALPWTRLFLHLADQ
jgi:hypothetical protein